MLLRMSTYGPSAPSVALSSFSLEFSSDEQVVDLLERRAHLGLVVGRDAAQLRGQVAGVDQQQVHGLLAALHLLEDEVAVLHQRHEVVAAGGEHLAHALRALQQRLDLLVARGHRLREPGDAAEALLDLRRRLVGGVGDDVERLRELVGVDPLGGRRQVAEDADDVVRRLGAVDRDHVVGGQLAGAGGLQLEVLLAEQAEHLDRGAGVLAELDPVVDVERHERPCCCP